MKYIVSKEVSAALKILGIYQIIGGGVGLIIIISTLFSQSEMSLLAKGVIGFICLFFSYSVLCGVFCLEKRKIALVHSLTNQALQLFSIAIMGYGFKFAAGVYVDLGLDLTQSIQLNFLFGISNFNLSWHGDPDKLLVNFNLVALALMYWIDKLMKKEKEAVTLLQAFSKPDN